MVTAALVVTLSLTAALVFVMMNRSDDRPASAAPAATGYPDHWNKRVVPYVLAAAKERGLKFAHPVPVRFLSPKAFAKSVTKDGDDLSREDRQDLANSTHLLRALGLVHGRIDLFREQNQLDSGGTLAYYSFRKQRITVRGHVLTPAVKSTLVHELTHVLQDQNFHIGDRMKQLHHDGDLTAASVLDAVIEGDAVRVEGRYRASLSAHQRAALDSAQKKESHEAMQRIRHVPPALVTMMESPYTLGQGLVETVAAQGDNRAVNRLFRHPPTHEVGLLDPSRVVERTAAAARQVSRPALKKGEKKLDSGELGAPTWYFMLGERIPLTEALAAADGWADDSYVMYAAHGTSCMRATYVGRYPSATDRMYADLQRWIADGSASTASVARHGSRLEFQSCDPGSDGDEHGDTTKAALALVGTRDGLMAGLTKRGASVETARCMAGRMVNAWSVDELNSPTFGADDPTIQSRLQQMAAECR